MTTWQDWVLALSILALNVALIPSLWGNKKPRILTSILTTLFLIPQLVVFVSLSLWYSFVMVLLNVTLWVILALQAYGLEKSKKTYKN